MKLIKSSDEFIPSNVYLAKKGDVLAVGTCLGRLDGDGPMCFWPTRFWMAENYPLDWKLDLPEGFLGLEIPLDKIEDESLTKEYVLRALSE